LFRNLLPFLLVLIVSCSKDPALFQVNFDVNPKDGGSINLNSNTYFEGETLNIEANASKNYVFDTWSGDFYGTDSTAVININSDKNLVANFSKKRFEINISIEGKGSVSRKLIKSGVNNDFSHGSIVEILALADDGWTFVEWKGDVSNKITNPQHLTVTQTKNITAIFQENISGKNASKFLALGDSYTIGASVTVNERWPVQFLNELKLYTSAIDTLQIIATSGWRVDQLKYGMDNSNLEPPYGLVSLLIGVNNQYQGQNANDFRPEFIEMLEKSLKLVNNRKERFFVISIPDWGASPYGFGFDRAKVSKEIDEFNSVVKEESEKRGLRYFDITAISRRALIDRTLIASDGLHPSGKMYKLWVDKIIPEISKINFD
jgi:lysophospholipase L1-like esterase